MNKLISKFVVLSVFAVAGVMSGCSSAQKSEDVPPSTDIVQTTEAAPVDLGATSSGRGL